MVELVSDIPQEFRPVPPLCTKRFGIGEDPNDFTECFYVGGKVGDGNRSTELFHLGPEAAIG
jgi:hypothetical protein